MTKEEARKILIEYTDMDKDVDSEYLQAIKVAISALENNDNSEENNDNSAEKTAECYKSHEMIEDRLHCKNCGMEKVITGHWKEYNYCPKCGRKIAIYKTPYRQNDE